MDAVATVIAGVSALPAAYLGWATFRYDRADNAALELGATADGLAAAVKKLWDDEAQIRRMNDPYPLPVSWKPADADLVEPWPLLADVARAWPGGPPGDPAAWPSDANGLAGSGGQIGEIFSNRVPTRRLVVLGEPGAGKTMLLIRLLQDLTERRTPGGPVPVLFSLASYRPAHQHLDAWMAEQLRHTHPVLTAPATTAVPAADAGAGRLDVAKALVDARLILPILDGLDELPATLHITALDAINRALPAKLPLVLACRATEYRTALTRPDAMVRLNGATGIRLLPLGPVQAADYLRRDAGGPNTPTADRWNSVANRLGTDSPIGQALSTPLGLFLARTIYNPRTPTGPVPHPDELMGYATREDLTAHLFNALIPAAYTPHQPNPPRWTPHAAQSTLAFLACHLEHNRAGTPDLAWWELHHAIPNRTRTRRLAGLAAGIVFGVLLGLAGGIATGLSGGLTLALAIALRTGSSERPSRTPNTAVRWSSNLIWGGLVGGLIAVPILGLIFGAGFEAGLPVDLPVGVLLVLPVGLVLGLAAGSTFEKPDLATTIGPARLLTLDRQTFMRVVRTLGTPLGTLAALLIGAIFWGRFGLAAGLAVGLAVGVAVALMAGVGFGRRRSSWAVFIRAKAYLVRHHHVVRNLMPFLEDAHHRGVLRQVGAVYQFRHIDLQRHLARQPWPPNN
ncbi:NACHT domain-containing protein [Streptomyces sp. NPDC087845]|uniref:NACHT domain-containing protein n=1 Tax=Streptomyces sp. NPDC087845 TaxID=3365806 RepID=UPI0037FFFC53